MLNVGLIYPRNADIKSCKSGPAEALSGGGWDTLEPPSSDCLVRTQMFINRAQRDPDPRPTNRQRSDGPN